MNEITRNGLYEEYFDETLYIRCFYKDGEFDGPYERYYKYYNQLCVRCTYKFGKLDGLYEEYSRLGVLLLKCTYKDDKKHGLFEEYFDTTDRSKQILCRCTYNDGKLDGMCELYNIYGGLSVRNYHKNGQLDGPYVEYYGNGKLRRRCAYKKDKPVGLWEEYWSDGSLKEKQYFAEKVEECEIKRSKMKALDPKLVSQLSAKELIELILKRSSEHLK